MTRDVHEGDGFAAGQARPGVAEVEGESAAVLLGPAVGVGAGERTHERRLAVVDVAGRGDDPHGLPSVPTTTSAASTPPARGGRRRSGSMQRRSTRIRRRRRRGRRRPGRRRAGRSRCDRRGRAGRRPDPAVGRRGPPAADAPVHVDHRAADLRGDGFGPRAVGVGGQEAAVEGDRRGRAGEGRLQRRESELVDAERAGQRVSAQALDGVGRAEQQARLGPAQQLVAGRRHHGLRRRPAPRQAKEGGEGSEVGVRRAGAGQRCHGTHGGPSRANHRRAGLGGGGRGSEEGEGRGRGEMRREVYPTAAPLLTTKAASAPVSAASKGPSRASRLPRLPVSSSSSRSL